MTRSHTSHPFRPRGLASLALVAACALALAGLASAHGFVGVEWKPLKKGSRGHLVAHVQEALGISADGIYGTRTVKAVKRFQKRKGLEVDGVVGPTTASALGLLDDETLEVATEVSTEGYPQPTAEEKATLDRIAECESGGDPTAVSSGGSYRGKYQFHTETWRRLGGSGDPIDASEAEQDYRALLLLRQSGTAPWANCA